MNICKKKMININIYLNNIRETMIRMVIYKKAK